MLNHSIYKYTTSTLVLSLTILTILSGIILSAPSASADTSANVNISVTVPSVCSLTADPASLTKTITPGHGDTIGTTNIKAICNDPAGLAVYAVGYTNDTYGNTNLTATAGASSINILTHVTPSGTPSASEWYMTLTAVSGDYIPTIVTNFDSAHEIPDVYTKVAYRNSVTDMGTNATGANFTAAFDAYIAENQAAGTYNGKVKFLLVHPHVLTYDSQTGQPDEVQPSTLECDPDSSPLLQDVSTWANTVALGETIDAIDARDNQCYKVKRLKMNAAGTETALWMSNLNLGAQPLTVAQLDNTNTHLDFGVSAIPAATFNSWIKSSGTNSYTDPELISFKSSNTCELYDEELDDYVSSSCPEQDSYGNKYGTLYNYAAASAGTYNYGMGYGVGDATSDLCPAGWRLPTGGSSGEFAILTTAYSLSGSAGAIALQEDLGFSSAGSFNSGVPLHGEGYSYWSSTFNSKFDMYALSALSPERHYGRGTGSSVRCISQ